MSLESLVDVETSLGCLVRALIAAKNAGWTHKDFEALASSPDRAKDALAAVRDMGSAIHAIECNKSPYVPKGLSLQKEPDDTSNRYIWNTEVIRVIPVKDLVTDKEHVENAFDREKGRLACAPILDYLLHHERLITHEMREILEKGEIIYFPGTIYLQKSLRTVRGMMQSESGLVGVSQIIQDQDKIRDSYVLMIK